MPEDQTLPTAVDGGPRPVRSCDGCTLCCKILSVEALDKPQGVWCVHCKTGSGCTFYDNRPTACRVFHCEYLLQPSLSEDWKPSHSRLMVTADAIENRITVHVDPARPDAWRRHPYYGTMKDWSRHAAGNQGQVVVTIGKRAIVIFPDRDVDLGVMGADELIVTGQRRSAAGVYLEAYVVARDDGLGRLIAENDGRPVAIDAKAGRVLRTGRAI
jgi:Fe-S-cluster containining protein